MAERILDMGDILSIAEKVESVVSEEEAMEQAKKLKKGNYDLEDFLMNLKQMKKLGPLEKLLGMLPQARQMGLNNINIDVLSMTKEERRNPEILKASRKQRIAKGSGRSVEEVNRLLKQFDMMKQMMKQFSNGKMKLPF